MSLEGQVLGSAGTFWGWGLGKEAGSVGDVLERGADCFSLSLFLRHHMVNKFVPPLTFHHDALLLHGIQSNRAK